MDYNIIENLSGHPNVFESIIEKTSVSSKYIVYAPTDFEKHYLIKNLRNTIKAVDSY